MPLLPHASFDASSVRRLSAKTSVLVKALAWSAVNGFAPAVNGAPVAPHPPIAHRFAAEMPVPFGKLTPVKLFQVNGIGRNVKGSEICSSSLGIHLNSRSPVNTPGANVAVGHAGGGAGH